jgi:FSR family fosmidomycin resistance protein-like MFS transporter
MGTGAGVVLSRAATAATGLLVLSIAARSLVGMSAERSHPDGAWLLIGVPAAGFCGKALGGMLADRVGWTRTVVVALVASAGCLAMPGSQGIGAAPVPLLGGLLCLHSTMPVMLVAVGRLMPARLGLAFGWDHFALAVGAAPTMFGWGEGLSGKPMQAAWSLLAAVAVPVALRASGPGGRRRQPEAGPERPALPLGMARTEP